MPDAWKRAGFVSISLPNGKTERLDLTSDGPVSVGRKDIFVWIAWMEDKDHSHKPDPKALQLVREAFANAPTKNADGTTGIRLHIFLSRTPVREVPILGSMRGSSYDWTAFNAIKKLHFPKELEGVFHFCVFAHDINAQHNSGISNGIGAYDFIVSLGAFGVNGKVADVFSQAGTFMHELGHNLGLRHGGSDDVHYKPNYLSVMNYLFQLTGLYVDKGGSQFDYSRFAIDADEAALDRARGLTSNSAWARYGTQFFCERFRTSQSVDSIVGQVDWDCSERTAGIVAQDVNKDSRRTMLKGNDDWAYLQLRQVKPSAGVSPRMPTYQPSDELSLEQANLIAVAPVAQVQAQRTTVGVQVSWRPIALDRVVAYEVVKKSRGSEASVGVVPAGQASLVDGQQPGPEDSYVVRGIYVPLGNPESPQVSQQVRQLDNLVMAGAQVGVVQVQATAGVNVLEQLGMKNYQPTGKSVLLLKTKDSPAARVKME